MDNSQFLLSQIRQSLVGCSKALLALSGGVDSMVLLHLLTLLRKERPDFGLRAIYINHGLSQHAALWGQHCHDICQRWRVPLERISVHVDSQKAGLEAGARSARYRVFAENLRPSEVLLTAQHLDDQCETVLLSIKRGSGPAGLSAMALSQQFAQSRQIRPLLHVSRHQIEAYAVENQLSWINDDSNEDDRFDRNFLRLRILPLIQHRWPSFARAAARSAELCAEQECLLDELLADALHKSIDKKGAISIADLQEMSEVKRWAVIRRWFQRQQAAMPSRQQLRSLWQEVALAKIDAEPKMTIADKTAVRFKQRLYLLSAMSDLRLEIISWNGRDDLVLPDNLGNLSLSQGEINTSSPYPIRAAKEGERITVRFSAVGEYRIVGRNHSRAIKKLWQEFQIAPWQRARTPLIYFNDTLIAALGVFVTLEGKVGEDDKPWPVVWRKN